MRNSQKGLVLQMVIVLVALIIGGGVYYFYNPFQKISEPRVENIDGQLYQVQDYAPNWGQK